MAVELHRRSKRVATVRGCLRQMWPEESVPVGQDQREGVHFAHLAMNRQPQRVGEKRNQHSLHRAQRGGLLGLGDHVETRRS